jgi:iron complex transport system substrate-binding protein
LVGASDRADALVEKLTAHVEHVRRQSAARPHRPRIYFEEWDDPMISGIAWVSELIAIAGGTDVFAELSVHKSAKDRIVAPKEVARRAPDIIIGSWCGKKFNREKVVQRPGFDAVPAVRNGQLHEIKSPLILQPGPAALTDGLAKLQDIIGGFTPRA